MPPGKPRRIPGRHGHPLPSKINPISEKLFQIPFTNHQLCDIIVPNKEHGGNGHGSIPAGILPRPHQGNQERAQNHQRQAGGNDRHPGLGTLSKLLAGISDSPKLSNIVAISEALDCSLDYLITGVPRNTNNCTLSEDELIFIGNYRLLDGYGRSLVDAVVNMEVDRAIRQQTDDAHRNVSPQGDAGEQAAYPASAARHRTLRGGQNELSATAPAESAAAEPGTASLLHLPGGHGRKDTAKRRRITLYDLPVSAGIGEFLSDAHATEISIPDVAQTVDADFALRIAGDSMEPNYHDGDILLVRRTESVTPGELGIFVLDGCGYFKKFDGDRLLSLNPAYPPILLKNFTQTACCGQVIGRMRKR